MGLVLPNLDDKPFSQIADEARQLIPSSAPEWTDHNVHDPGITFVELFAWLAEIEHYRLNRTAATSYERFFSLMGLTPFPPRAALVTVLFEFKNLPNHIFIPANTPLAAVGLESIPFRTIHDQYLSKAKLSRVVTEAGGARIVQTAADTEDVGHYEAFGPSPAVGDSLLLEFSDWFTEPQCQLEITLFDEDVPAANKGLNEVARGFEPSASILWECRVDTTDIPPRHWEPLTIIRDGTLNLSRSGEVIFKRPEDASASIHRQIRAVLTGGRYEIPPRIASIRTNTIRGRQIETIVNEPLAEGLSTADQTVQLTKAPLFVNDNIDDGLFQAGEVLDWRALIERLNNLESYQGPQKEALRYVLNTLSNEARQIIRQYQAPNNVSQPTDDDKYSLTQAFNELIAKSEFYKRAIFPMVTLSEAFERAVREQRCQKTNEVRRTNRFVLQRLFRDLFVGDRLEIQTRRPGALSEDEGLVWTSWDAVENFSKSGPDDLHYVVDQQTGVIRFGNGLNGKVPEPSESIRARFYRYSQLEKGNLPARRQWTLALNLPPGVQITKQDNISGAAGGGPRETLDDTKLRVREVFRKETAILTARDYEQFALSTPGLRVARVKVVPNSHPKLPCMKMPGEVTIIVLPQQPPRIAFPNHLPQEPSEGFLSTVRNYLESRRLVTTNIHVIGPQFVEVSVTCSVFLKKRASATEALKSVKDALGEFFDPVLGGPEKGEGWPFGRPVFASEVSQQLSKLPAIDYVTGVSFNDQHAGKPLKLPYNGLPKSGSHSINILPFEDRGGRRTEVGCKGNECD